MTEYLCTDAYYNDDSAIKTGFALAFKIAKETDGEIDIVLAKLDSFKVQLKSLIGTQNKRELDVKRKCNFRGVDIKLYSQATIKKLSSSSTMLLVCTSDNITKSLEFIRIDSCVVVPLQDSNAKFWQSYTRAK